MIDRKEIENLATLSRIKLTEAEKDSFQKEIESILGYVAVIQKASGEKKSTTSGHLSSNIFREDVEKYKGGEYTEDLLKAAPAREGDYVKVKNIF